MDKSSTKLTGLITKLTVAANKAAKKEDTRKVQTRSPKKDFNVSLRYNQIDSGLHFVRLAE